MSKQEEILKLRRLYLVQFEKFETKVFFMFLSFSITLVILSFKLGISIWWGIGLFLFVTLILDTILGCWRKKSFNKVIKEIKSGNLGEIE